MTAQAITNRRELRRREPGVPPHMGAHAGCNWNQSGRKSLLLSRAPWTVIIALCTVLIGSGFAIQRHSMDAEPVYAGKTISQWLDSGQEDALYGVHAIGLAAAPYIVHKLVREDPQWGSFNRYRAFRLHMPRSLRAVLPRAGMGNFDQDRAYLALLELGPKSIPLIAEQLRNGNPAVRNVSARVLGSWAERGKNLRPVAPLLVLGLSDSDPQVRASARFALAQTRRSAR